MSAIESFRRDSIIRETERTMANTPAGAFQFLILENHDTDRLHTRIDGAEWKLRVAAALQFTLPGIPCIYYGQEIGMKGRAGQWGNDGNDIPRREAFEWYREVSGPGMALWYARSGPWWDGSNLRRNDGISLEEQKRDSSSLWHHYSSLIHVRRTSAALRRGDFTAVPGNNDNILAFLRRSHDEAQTVLVAVNLTDAPQEVRLDLGAVGIVSGSVTVARGGRGRDYRTIGEANKAGYGLNLGPAEYLVLEVH
jgi:glycosidase